MSGPLEEIRKKFFKDILNKAGENGNGWAQAREQFRLPKEVNDEKTLAEWWGTSKHTDHNLLNAALNYLGFLDDKVDFGHGLAAAQLVKRCKASSKADARTIADAILKEDNS